MGKVETEDFKLANARRFWAIISTLLPPVLLFSLSGRLYARFHVAGAIPGSSG